MANATSSTLLEKLQISIKYCGKCWQKFARKVLNWLSTTWLYRYWHQSIRRQLILGIALVHAILMTIFIIDLTDRQRYFLQQESVQQALGLAETLAANSSSWVLASDVVGLSEILNNQMRYPGLEYALVISMRGQVLAHTDAQWIGHYLSDDISRSLFSDESPVLLKTQLLFQNSEFLDVAAPITSGDSTIGWVKVGISTRKTMQNLQVVTRDGLIYTVLAILVGVLFAIWMAKELTKGLKNLMLIIEQVKLGERQIQADESRIDEIGYLAKGFNAMLRAIKESDEKMREAKRVAEAANLAKSQFIANMSHELRTPLNAVIGYSEMLQEEYEELTAEEILDDLHKINASGKHLLSLINDVLDLSKIESGKMEIFNETFDILKMMQDVLVTVDVLIKRKQNCLVFQPNDNLGLMFGDLTKIRQVLLNLLSNAAKFTENGTITLTIDLFEKQEQSWVNFTIQDTGIGIAPAQQQHLFQAFQQVDGSTTRKYGGTGLGLVISKRLIEMMGGTICLQSDLGQGTKFVVSLPTKTVIPHHLPIIESSQAQIPIKDNQVTILVIDDDVTVRELLTRHLHRLGYHVVVAEDGQKGLQLAKQIRPNAITLDVMMPGVDGWMVLSELKKDEQLQNIPVIMLSMVENQELGYALGAADYLLKPIDQKQLLNVLQKYRQIKQRNYVIMVVEDDVITQDLTRDMLQRQGWHVTLANNGKQALALAQKQPPDLILLDLMMPEMDGFEFITQLRHNAALSNIPVIVLTAKDITKEDRTYLTTSVNAIFQKSAYQRDDLLAQLQELLMLSAHNTLH